MEKISETASEFRMILEKALQEGTRGRKRKLFTFAILFETACPACGQPKDLLRWLCFSCWEKNHETPESKALDRACVAHMKAVKAYIERCQKAS